MGIKSLSRYSIDLAENHRVCESNYEQLLHLLPLDAGENFILNISLAQHNCQVIFNIRERCPYTTLVDISFKSDWGSWIAPPEMQIRIYHDVRMVEVANITGQRQLAPRYNYPNPHMYQPDEKQQLNQFLADCLDLCRKGGEVMEISPLLYDGA